MRDDTDPPEVYVATLYGWDVSDHDIRRGLTADRVRAAAELGITFVTYQPMLPSGTELRHRPRYGPILAAALNAGIPFLGGYVVVRPDVSAASQARAAISRATAHTPWWPALPSFFWQIGLDRLGRDDTPPTLGAEVAAALESRTRKAAVLYAAQSRHPTAPLGSYPRWHADHSRHVDEDFRVGYRRAGGDSGPGWTAYGTPLAVPMLWRYTSNARIGAQSACAAYAFRGGIADFAKMIGIIAPPGANELRQSHFVTAYPGFILPADGAFHTIRWSDGKYGYRLTETGVVSHRARLSLRGLHRGDLVRLRAVYRIPDRPGTYSRLLAQERVPADPSATDVGFTVDAPNESHRLQGGSTVTFTASVTPGNGDTSRLLRLGSLNWKSVLLFA